jgi:hypothetical protein
VGGLTWDEAWANVKDSVVGPIVRLLSALLGLVTTVIDALQLAITATGLGGGVIEQTLQEFKARWLQEVAGLEEEIGETVSPGVKAAFVAMMRAAGVELDPDEPLSAESISAAVSVLIGYPFENIFDKEALERDLKNIASEKIEETTGIPINLNDEESIGNFAAALIVAAVKGELQKIDISAVCPAVNTVAAVLCKTPNCHACMNDEEDCKARRAAQKKNRSKYDRNCVRTPR